MTPPRHILEHLLRFGPDRVLISIDGEATTPHRALRDYKIVPQYFWIRDDGWSLGAPQYLISVGSKMWAEYWIWEGSFEDLRQLVET